MHKLCRGCKYFISVCIDNVEVSRGNRRPSQEGKREREERNAERLQKSGVIDSMEKRAASTV
jgi:hypothetical protein